MIFFFYSLKKQLWTLTYFLPLYKLAAHFPYVSSLRLFINKYAAWTSFNKEPAFSARKKKIKKKSSVTHRNIPTVNTEALQEVWNTESAVSAYKGLVWNLLSISAGRIKRHLTIGLFVSKDSCEGGQECCREAFWKGECMGRGNKMGVLKISPLLTPLP